MGVKERRGSRSNCNGGLSWYFTANGVYIREDGSGPDRGAIIAVGDGLFDDHIDFWGQGVHRELRPRSRDILIGMDVSKTAPVRVIFNNCEAAGTKIDGAFGVNGYDYVVAQKK